jgi:hypothetical protein
MVACQVSSEIQILAEITVVVEVGSSSDARQHATKAPSSNNNRTALDTVSYRRLLIALRGATSLVKSVQRRPRASDEAFSCR